MLKGLIVLLVIFTSVISQAQVGHPQLQQQNDILLFENTIMLERGQNPLIVKTNGTTYQIYCSGQGQHECYNREMHNYNREDLKCTVKDIELNNGFSVSVGGNLLVCKY
jgi:hypothetical protein